MGSKDLTARYTNVCDVVMVTPTAVLWIAKAYTTPASCRVYSLNPIEDFRPPTLTGHKDTPVAVYFAGAHFCRRRYSQSPHQLLRGGIVPSFHALSEPAELADGIVTRATHSGR